MLFIAVAFGRISAFLFFGMVSFLALREFGDLCTPRPAAGHARLGMLAVVLSAQYVLLALGMRQVFLVFIPVYVFLFIPIQNALQGDTEHFLQRTAVTQWGITLCVYCISYAPALLDLKIRGFEGENPRLLMFLLLVCQLSDTFQYIWGKLLGKHRISALSPNKTWEGLVLGGGSAIAVGAGLWWATPFNPIQSAGMALLIVTLGFLGGQALSAVKRGLEIKDFGALIPGHGGVLDRMDSVCFAAPVFYLITRRFFGS